MVLNRSRKVQMSQIRYVSKFTAASRDTPCDSMAFLYSHA